MTLEKHIRSKRFKVKQAGQLRIQIESRMGNMYFLEVDNVSRNGLSAIGEGLDLDESMEAEAICPHSKLLWGEDDEAALSRLAIRRIIKKGNQIEIAFGGVDLALPFASISKFLEETEEGGSSLDFEISRHQVNFQTFEEAGYEDSDLFEKCRHYDLYYRDCLKSSAYQYYNVKRNIRGNRMEMTASTVRDQNEFVNFASFDYLGLSQHPSIKEATIRATEKYGLSSGGSLALSGKTEVHEELEARLAQLTGKEDVVLFSTGYPANVAPLTALIRRNDLAIADHYVHASIKDGIANSQGQFKYFKHNNMQHLEEVIAKSRKNYSGCMLVTEGLFSMDGDFPDLQRFVNLAKENNCKTFVDEAHSFAVFGRRGVGSSEHQKVLQDIDVYMGTLSKGLGTAGGFVATSRVVAQWIRFFGRSGLFSTGLLPIAAAGALQALEVLSKEPQRRTRLQHNISRFRSGLIKMGVKCTSDPSSPIIPVAVGSDENLHKVNKVLLERQIFANPVFYPAVAVGSSRIRFSITSEHSDSDIDLALIALELGLSKIAA